MMAKEISFTKRSIYFLVAAMLFISLTGFKNHLFFYVPAEDYFRVGFATNEQFEISFENPEKADLKIEIIDSKKDKVISIEQLKANESGKFIVPENAFMRVTNSSNVDYSMKAHLSMENVGVRYSAKYYSEGN